MAKLTSTKRNALPNSVFALGGRKYPIPDRAHAANTKARAMQQYNKGNLSLSSMQKIKSKANRMLSR